MIALLAAAVSCGGASDEYYEDVVTGSTPIVSRLDPALGPAGTAVTIFGLGFSYVTPTNIVTMGTEGAAAETYTILPSPTASEIESITFTVPLGLAPGNYPVVVVVHEAASNSNVEFQVTP